ncbi:MAG TPA: hypothetical protein VHX59_03115 [Mycobacteriales bacterium]|jgi:hypothetical protein|nr:hypothetical protein [Mycobacteriales bacterium]
MPADENGQLSPHDPGRASVSPFADTSPHGELHPIHGDKPVTEWSYLEWESYRLRCENEELRAKLDETTSPREAQLHAIRWALIIGSVGVEFALAIALSATLSIVFWTLFAAETLGLMAYGLVMDEYRSSRKRSR